MALHCTYSSSRHRGLSSNGCCWRSRNAVSVPELSYHFRTLCQSAERNGFVLKGQPTGSVPTKTARIARQILPNGNRYLTLRDELGSICSDHNFSSLFPTHSQPAQRPWQLALVSVMQFSEDLSDRQSAEAVKTRIDRKYALGLKLADPGFNFSVLR